MNGGCIITLKDKAVRDYIVEVSCDSMFYFVKASSKKSAIDIVYSECLAHKVTEDRAEGYLPVFKKT